MKNLNVKNKKVLIRVDFNVPLDAQHKITDDTRMRAAIPTIKHILKNGGAVILMSHLGRPQKKRREDGSIDVERFTLGHLVRHLSKLLRVKVKFAEDCIGKKTKEMAKALKPGEVLLLENTRFHPEEEKGDAAFAKKLAALGNVYVNDAFGTAHRKHASTATIAQFFCPSNKAFGLLMQAEIENANKILNNPKRPLTAIIGGAKVSDKILLLEKLIDFADNLVIGGGMAYTFIRALGGKTGNSLVEEDKIKLAERLLKKARKKGVKILLPKDSIVADSFSAKAKKDTKYSKRIPKGWMGLDIGPLARKDFSKLIELSATILWNGPMGVFEMKPFAKGTQQIAKALAKATAKGAFSLVGGGDSVAAVNQMGLTDKVSYVSTGGGAMLEFLEGKELPGIKYLL
ncbi:MAG TPA: phosphoglycerate kinase [Phaeodactylibacter sp.]|nr:phosphoglycerate kinase [Phaeodactylibacter sp.]